MADLSPREELLKLQKRIFAKNDDFIRSQTLVRERGFEGYERGYKRYVRNYEKISSIDELIEAILAADIIYLGDYHTNKQSQRTLLRLLKLIIEKTPSLGIGLELVLKRHQPILDDYLASRIEEKTFLKKIRFDRYWYPELWPNFQPIFEFAKYHQIALYGIESSLGGDLTLTERDRRSAQIIGQIVKQHPTQRLILFLGDLHIAPPHLPAEVRRTLKEKKIEKTDLILYQNSEPIYWKLAEKELEEQVEIVRVDDRSFCIINTPPIVWQQSYLNWLEHEEGTIDYADAKHSFLELVRQIAEFLETPLPARADDVEVFTSGDLSFLKKLSEAENFSKTEIRRIKKQILASESYCMPQRKIVYLATLSLNHAGEEAAHYLKFLCAGPEFSRDPVDAFYANTLHEALGFFGSKIVNHKRKCFHEKDYQGVVQFLRSTGVPKGRHLELETALLVLEHKKLEKKGAPIRSRRYLKHDLFFGVTHGLGYMLGDRLYYALLAEKITKEEIRDLFYDRMKGEGKPFELYLKLLRKLRGTKIPRRV